MNKSDDFFDGINLDVNFPVVPQEKLAYFREFSLVKLLKSPLNLPFDVSIDEVIREERERESRRKENYDSRIIRSALNRQNGNDRRKEF